MNPSCALPVTRARELVTGHDNFHATRNTPARIAAFMKSIQPRIDLPAACRRHVNTGRRRHGPLHADSSAALGVNENQPVTVQRSMSVGMRLTNERLESRRHSGIAVRASCGG